MIEGERTEVRESRIKLIPFDEIRLGTGRRYLIKGLVPRVGLTVVWGPPKCGKSFWVFLLTMHVALGWEYRGGRVQRGSVVYCAFEGQSGMEARVEAFRQRFLPDEPEPIPFFLETLRLNLVRDHKELIAVIRRQLGDNGPAAVVLDTLNRSLSGSESSDEDMTAYVDAADAIREEFGCSVIIVHHCGIGGTRPRGHSSLGGAADAQIAVRKDAADNIVAEVDLMKDGPTGDLVTSRLESASVGLDEDGEEITSCVVVPVDDGEAKAAVLNTKKLTDPQRLAMSALTECILARGEPVPSDFGLPGKVLATTLDQWRDEMTARGVIDGEGSNPRVYFKRIKDGLAARQLIGERNGLVWSAKAEPAAQSHAHLARKGRVSREGSAGVTP